MRVILSYVAVRSLILNQLQNDSGLIPTATTSLVHPRPNDKNVHLPVHQLFVEHGVTFQELD